MSRFITSVVLLGCLLPLQAGKYKGLWLRMSDETAPAGGVAQVRFTLTEPKPIIRTRMDLEFDDTIVGDIVGIALFSGSGEATGTAIRMGNRLHVEALSPTANWGMDENLPLLTVSVRLRDDAPAGARAGFRIAPESVFYEQNGGQWNVEDNAPGSVTVGPDFAINQIVPSGGFIQAGQTVRVMGVGFAPGTQAGIEGVEGLSATVVSPTEIALTSTTTYQLDQRRVSVVDPWARERSFFAALEGFENAPSVYDLLAATQPMFSPRAETSASFVVPQDLTGGDPFAGVAIQNPTSDMARVKVTALDAAGTRLGKAYLTLLGTERVVRDISELMPGVTVPAGTVLQIESDVPLQVLGLAGSLTTATVLPLPAQAAPTTAAKTEPAW